jgi:Tfp pilus assembly protein FimT
MKQEQGFSLAETLIVITLMILLATTGYAVSLSIICWQSLLHETNLITSQIALAQMSAYSGEKDQSHGIKILEGELVRFIGDSYTLRNQEKDVVFSLSERITFSGDDEVVFLKGGLAPDQSSAMTLEMGIRTHQITVSSYGVLNVTKRISES